MARRHSVSVWSIVALQALTGYLARRNFGAVPDLNGNRDPCLAQDTESVSIVIPARDEAENVPNLLQSLGELRGVHFEVTVVDDASTDGTGAVAEGWGARVLRISGPPPGWTGKAFACWTGASETNSDWILFTDADTVHSPDSLLLALEAARRYSAGVVSLLPGQRCETIWEKLLLPYAYALYFAGAVRPNRHLGPSIANGQYLLVRRRDYVRLGGHAAVRSSIIEDVDFAKLARRLGTRVMLMRAQHDVSVRMYSGLPHIWEGFGKNAFRFMRASPVGGALTVLAGMSVAASVPAALSGGSLLRRLALLVVPAATLAPWMRQFGVRRFYALLHPVAAVVFQILAIDSIRRTIVPGHTEWKGRRY